MDNIDDKRDKIFPLHLDMLRRMLCVNEIPEAVVLRYFAVKKPLDKCDGGLSPMDLLRMAMDVGFNPETGLFEEGPSIVKEFTDKIETLDEGPGEDTTIDEVVPQKSAAEIAEEEAKEKALRESIDKVERQRAEAEAEELKQQEAEAAAGVLPVGTMAKVFYQGAEVECEVQHYDDLDETYTVKIETEDGDVTVDDLNIDDLEV